MESNISKYLHIEEEFFDLDKESKIATMKLHFSTPGEIFDQNSISKLPILSDDFLDWMKSAFELTPPRYKIELEVEFDDLGEYSSENLHDIFIKNMLLEARKVQHKVSKQNIIALSLVGVGLVSFVAMLLVNFLWKAGGVGKEIFTYIADIATTVTFWEAMTILIVQNKERRSYQNSLLKRFGSIKFVKVDSGVVRDDDFKD